MVGLSNEFQLARKRFNPVYKAFSSLGGLPPIGRPPLPWISYYLSATDAVAEPPLFEVTTMLAGEEPAVTGFTKL
jgi:hypothetical protein